MYMIDRQWIMMSRMRATMQEQAEDLRALRTDVKALDRQVGSGTLAAARPAATPAAPAAAPVFDRALAASRLAGFAPGDWLVRAFGVGLSTITPLVSQDVYASNVQSYVQETLLSRNPDTLEWQGFIARSWDIGEDGLTITFQLRDGVAFSDGRPLRAGDVAFTFDFIMNESIAAPRDRAYLEKIESVEATGPLEVVFRFREPYFNALALAGGMAVMPRHFYEPYLEEPATFNESKGLLLGSGPYRLADPKAWTPDLGIVELERNPRYWGPAAAPFGRILWKVIENDSARLTTFRNRDIDAYTARPPGVPGPARGRGAHRTGPAFRVHERGGGVQLHRLEPAPRRRAHALRGPPGARGDDLAHRPGPHHRRDHARPRGARGQPVQPAQPPA